jgi:NAD(P)H-hydrate epimerase
LVTVAVPKSLEDVVAAGGPPEAMTLALPESDGGLSSGALKTLLTFCQKRRVTALALGPGLGQTSGVRAVVGGMLRSSTLPIVLDADGLNVLAGKHWPRHPSLILTPHPGEAARLLKRSAPEVQSDRPASARALSLLSHGVGVLKGHRTIVDDGQRTWVNTTGNPAMASGGMGDVLTGLIAALIPQVTATTDLERLWRAAVLGVRWHGLAGDALARATGNAPLRASHLAAHLPATFHQLFKSV